MLTEIDFDRICSNKITNIVKQKIGNGGDKSINVSEINQNGYNPRFWVQIDDEDNKNRYLVLQANTNIPLGKVLLDFTTKGFEFTTTCYKTREQRQEGSYELIEYLIKEHAKDFIDIEE